MSRFERVIARIDEANAADPTQEEAEGAQVPAALLYGQRMSAMLVEFCRDPSEVLRIAARGQHIERWNLPRADYPEGRAGYLAWRTAQARRHADRLAELMAAEGYGVPERERVGALVRKEGIKRDPEVQALEDVICLVFLRHYALDFAGGHAPEDVERILARTARKMSSEGRAAVAGLGLPEEVASAFAT